MSGTAKDESSPALVDVSVRPADDKVSLKLFIHKKQHTVMLAEAAKPFVDFLINGFSLPLGIIVEEGSSFGKLKRSMQNLHNHYLLPNIKIHDLLSPKTYSLSPSNCLLLAYEGNTTIVLYKCPAGRYTGCFTNLTKDPSTHCSSCGNVMSTKMNVMPQVAPAVVDGGYVKDVVKYVVTDDFEVHPMSTMLICTLLQKIDTKDLEEKVVYLGKEEALKLLMTSLTSDKVLTDMFMVKKED